MGKPIMKSDEAENQDDSVFSSPTGSVNPAKQKRDVGSQAGVGRSDGTTEAQQNEAGEFTDEEELEEEPIIPRGEKKQPDERSDAAY